MIVTRAQELLGALNGPPNERVLAAVAVIREETERPQPPATVRKSGGPLAVARRVRDRLGAGEASRSEDATAALLALRREVLLSVPAPVVGAHVPELREEVKRLVAPDEACYDIYLRLLDRIETGHPDVPLVEPGSQPNPAPPEPAVPSQRVPQQRALS